jgi:hypothetical protein
MVASFRQPAGTGVVLGRHHHNAATKVTRVVQKEAPSLLTNSFAGGAGAYDGIGSQTRQCGFYPDHDPPAGWQKPEIRSTNQRIPPAACEGLKRTWLKKSFSVLGHNSVNIHF